MSSVTYTGTCFLPSCTAIVCPTIWGNIVDGLDQVFNTFFSLAAFISTITLSSLAFTKGPFFSDLPIIYAPSYFSFFLFTIYLPEALFFFLVLYPSVGLPHGVTGLTLPIPVLPSPPP